MYNSLLLTLSLALFSYELYKCIEPSSTLSSANKHLENISIWLLANRKFQNNNIRISFIFNLWTNENKLETVFKCAMSSKWKSVEIKFAQYYWNRNIQYTLLLILLQSKYNTQYCLLFAFSMLLCFPC